MVISSLFACGRLSSLSGCRSPSLSLPHLWSGDSCVDHKTRYMALWPYLHLSHNLDFQPRKYPVKKDTVMPGNQTNGLPAQLTIPQPQLLDCLARDTLSDKSRALDNDTRDAQVCSSSCIILLCHYWKRRTTGRMQFDHHAVCATISVVFLNEVTNDFGNIKVEVPMVKLEICWNAVWLLAERQRELA